MRADVQAVTASRSQLRRSTLTRYAREFLLDYLLVERLDLYKKLMGENKYHLRTKNDANWGTLYNNAKFIEAFKPKGDEPKDDD